MKERIFMQKYYPDAEKVMFLGLRMGGFNLTDSIFEREGDLVIDLRIGFGY